MPKVKAKAIDEKKKKSEPEVAEKIIEIDTEEKEIDPEIMAIEESDEELEDEAVLDDEEVNPFGDKWEE